MDRGWVGNECRPDRRIGNECGPDRRIGHGYDKKAYGGGMVMKGDMWDNIVTMKGRRYAMESELTKRR